MAATEGLVPGHHLRTYDGERAECECGVEIHWKGYPEEHVWHLIDVSFEAGLAAARRTGARPVADVHTEGRQTMAQEQRIQQVEDDVDRVDPENPTSMVVPVPGDRVLMTDGSTARVAARREVGGGVMLQVQRAGLDYAEWVGVEEIEAHLDDGRVHDPVEAEGETRLMVGPCTCAGQADPECDCTGCIGRHIECRLTDPWSDTAEPEGEPADVGED